MDNLDWRELMVAEFPHIRCEVSAPLSKLCTFGIGGPADVLFFVDNHEDLQSLLVYVKAKSIECFLLGGGSNILFGDLGFRGVVLKLDGAFKTIDIFDEGRQIKVGAAASFPKLTKLAIEHGWSSALGWVGTPGSVGGALVMNAGSRHGEIGDTVHEVFALDLSARYIITKEEAGFEYRKSAFSSNLLLTGALLKCEVVAKEDVFLLKSEAKKMRNMRKSTQPKYRSAGSIFKNPPGNFAGALIEKVGLKGESKGGAEISEMHANFIVNKGDALAEDVIYLALMAQKKVFDRFNVHLEWEVKRIGDFGFDLESK